MIVKDIQMLRELGKSYAQIAFSEQQKLKIQQWKQLNSLHPVKPMLGIEQLPWNELNINGELTLHCEDHFCRTIEQNLRQILFHWKHLKTDRVVMPYVEIPKSIEVSNMGIQIQETTAKLDDSSGVAAHHYDDQIPDHAALNLIHPVTVSLNEELTRQHQAAAEEIFADILPVRMSGFVPSFRVWDQLATYRGVTPILYDLVDRPEFLHQIMRKLTDINLDMLRQYEQLGLLDQEAPIVHSSGVFTDELPQPDFDGRQVRASDCWASGMAQLFSNCSVQMHDEFEITYCNEYYRKCGLVYYGCCEPLHHKIGIIRKIKNVRKISISPWADVTIAAENIGSDYVLSRKPNPAFLAETTLDEERVRREILQTLKVCRENHTPCEFLLKDISTVNYHPEKLFRWSELAASLINEF